MDIMSNRTPSFSASAIASVIECSDEYCEGISSTRTFLFPRASTANTSVIAESMPPDNPNIALLNPDFRK